MTESIAHGYALNAKSCFGVQPLSFHLTVQYTEKWISLYL